MKRKVTGLFLVLCISLCLIPVYTNADDTNELTYPEGAIILQEGETYEIPIMGQHPKLRGFSQYATLHLSVSSSTTSWTLTPVWYAISPVFKMSMLSTTGSGMSNGTRYVTAFSGSVNGPGYGGHVQFSGSFSCAGCYDRFSAALWAGR